MYQVILYGDHTKDRASSKVIHSDTNFGEKLLDGQILEEVNAIPTFEASLPIDNVAYGRIQEYQHYIEIYDMARGRKKVFDGRVIEQSIGMDSSGEHVQDISCEGKLGYLRDSTQEFRATLLTPLAEYFKIILNTHNSQVEDHKKIYLGTIKPKTEDDKVYRSIGYASTADTIKDKILDRLGGYLVLTENEHGLLFLNYYAEYGEEKTTPIQLAKNLASADKTTDISDLASVVVPLGEEIPKDSDEGTERLESDFAKERYTIKSVNNGSLELVDEELVKLIGRRRKEVIFPNASSPAAIKNQGLSYLRNQRIALVSWKVNVLDISLQDPQYDEYELYNYYPLDNPYISASRELLQIVSKKIDLIEPMRVELDIGNKAKTLSQYQNENNSQIHQLEPTKERVTQLSQSFSSASAQVENIDKKASEAAENAFSAAKGVTELYGNVDEVAKTQEQLAAENKVLRSQVVDLEKRLTTLENSK